MTSEFNVALTDATILVCLETASRAVCRSERGLRPRNRIRGMLERGAEPPFEGKSAASVRELVEKLKL